MQKTVFFILFCIAFTSQAQVVYTDVNPDSLVNTYYDLDLNNDSTPEFRIEKTTDGGINIVQVTGLSNQDSIAGFYGGFPEVAGYPYALSTDEIIGANSNLIDEGILGGDHELIMEDAEWPDGFNRYLGLKFTISGEPHYGWAKIKISTDYVAFTISEYAYNATAGEAINSGITSIPENNSSISEVSLFPNPVNENATITFYVRNESEVETAVYDVSGKLILAERRKIEKPGKQAFQLNVSQLNAGIYFCRVNSATLKLSVIH